MSGFDPGHSVGNSETWHRSTPWPTHSSATGSRSLKLPTGSGIPPGRIRQLLRDRKLLAVQRPDGSRSRGAAFFDGGQILKGLHGTLTVLFDCGFDDEEAVRWLFTADDSLPGTPIQAMAEHRGTEVNRRAQALAI